MELKQCTFRYRASQHLVKVQAIEASKSNEAIRVLEKENESLKLDMVAAGNNISEERVLMDKKIKNKDREISNLKKEIALLSLKLDIKIK